MNIAFLGMGKFGQAIASLVAYNGLTFDYAEVSEGRLLSRPVDLLFITVPAQFVRPAIEANREWVSDKTIIVNCSKGIEESTHLMVHQIVAELGRFPAYYSLIGPSFAEGIIAREPTVVSLGYKSETHIEAIRGVLETSYFRVLPNRGYRALELASALKNLYAIVCGYAHGLGLGPNTRVRLITTGLDEFQVLARAMHFTDYDVLAPGVVGDLMLTCSSEESRNFQYGVALSHGHTEDLEHHTVEGYHTSHSINTIARAHHVRLPLADLTSRLIAGRVSGVDNFREEIRVLTLAP